MFAIKVWEMSKKNKKIRLFLSFLYNCLNKNKKSIKGKLNHISYEQAFLKNVSFKIIGENNNIIIKENTRLTNVNILIMGNNHLLVVAEDCNIKNSGFVFEDSGCVISIGKGTTMEGVQSASLEKKSSIQIGEDCMFSAGISIRNSDSHSIITKGTGERINHAKDIRIGDHVWIGEGVKILKGAIIGNDSVVGMGSIVNKFIPENSLAIGIPAKIIKEGISWKRERIPK